MHATTGDHVTAVTADFQLACIEDGIVSQIVLFETCVAMKFVDDDDDDDFLLVIK